MAGAVDCLPGIGNRRDPGDLLAFAQKTGVLDHPDEDAPAICP